MNVSFWLRRRSSPIDEFCTIMIEDPNDENETVYVYKYEALCIFDCDGCEFMFPTYLGSQVVKIVKKRLSLHKMKKIYPMVI